MNVLITSASRKVALIREFKRALKEEGGGFVVAVDASNYAVSLQFADKAYIVPRMDRPDFWPILSQICAQEGIGLIVPTRDEELALFASNREFFDELGVVIAVAPLSVVETCLNKETFSQFCINNGFNLPETLSYKELLISSVANRKLFVRDKLSKGSRNAMLVENREDLDYAMAKFSSPIVQELVDAPEFTVDLFMDFSANVISVVPRERISVFGGESFVGRTRKEWRIIEETRRLAVDLGLVAHNTIQCFFRDNEVLFIEVNPRYGGGAHLGFAAGASTPQYLVRLAMGKSVKPVIGQFQDGLVMMRFTEDIFLHQKELGKINNLK